MRALLLASLALAASPLPQSTVKPVQAQETPGATEPVTLTMLYSRDHRIWSPNNGSSAKDLVFQPFCHLHGDQLVSGLLESWEASEDQRTVTYHMRTDVHWHDGIPVTSADVEFSHRLLAHPDVLKLSARWISMEVVDDSTFTVHYGFTPALPCPPGPWIVYPKHLLEDLEAADFASWAFWERPVGNGPFRYVRHLPYTMVELAANPDHNRGRPRIDCIILKFGTQGLVELRSGQVDVAAFGTINRADAYQLTLDPRFHVYRELSEASVTLWWNHRLSQFADLRVRRALTLAIDRRELMDFAGFPADYPIWDVPPTGIWRPELDLPAPLPHDPETARQLLEEAGWSDEDGNGVRERGDEELLFRAMIWPGEDATAVLVQQQLRDVGAHMEIELTGEREVWRNRFEAGEFEAAINTVHSNMGGFPEELMRTGVHGPSGYESPTFARAVSEAQRDLTTRTGIEAMYRSLWPILQEELPFTILMPSDRWKSAAHRKLKGLKTSFDPEVFGWMGIATHMDELWVEEGE